MRTLTTLVFAVLMATGGAAAAQESTAEVRGRVLDAQGGALPGVTITITNQATGVYRAVVSNEDGTYFVTALAPGTYAIAAELSGFKKYMRSDIRLDLGKTTTLDLDLQIGGVTESVEVSAETPLVDTTSKQIGGNVTSREAATLPSVNGNFVGLVALLPGVVANISTESFGSDAVSVNGMDSRNNNYMLDGANNNDDVIGQRAGSQARTPVEAIAEFQVVTNQYDAEFGRTIGAVINAISKQGGNAFHGVGAALLQDASMTRPDFFVKQNGLTKPNTRFQTYRANIGGPIVRDKAHFFANLERVMVNRPTSITIPSHTEFNASPVTRDRVWNTLLRFDHQVNATNTWTVRWLRESSPQVNQIVPYLPPFPAAQNLTVTENASREEHDVDQTAVGTWNSVLSNTKVNTMRVNFTREDVAFANPAFNTNGQSQATLEPTLAFLTYVDQQSPVAQARVNNAYQLDDTFSWFIPRGGTSHDVKMGGQFEYVTARSTTQDNLNGVFFFRSDLPFSAGNPSTYPERLYVRVPGALDTLQQARFASAFAQDKWMFNKRTTLSVGLRYDVEVQPIREVDNPRFTDPDKYPVDKNNFQPRIGLTYDLSGDGQAIVRGGYGRFYDKTHFELISNILTAGVFSTSFNTFFPSNNADPGPSAGTLPQEPMLAGGPTVNRTLLAALFPAGSRIKNTGNVTLDNPDRTIPYADQITAGYERQMATNLSVSADYIHTQARDQFMLQDLNPGIRASTARTATLVRVDPAFTAAVNQPVNLGKIDYDGLEAALVKRFAADYSFRVSYTLGYARGNTSGLGIPTSGFQFLDDMHLELNEGPTNFDRRHNLVISGQALVPRARGIAVSWVARALSGAPFSPIDSTLDQDRNGAFAEPLPEGTYTGTGRNPYTADVESTRNGAVGPGLFQLDLRLGYRGRYAGRTVDLFADVFNVTNRANFDNPIGDQRSTDFMRLTTLRPGAIPTTLQLGARFEF